MQFLNLVVFLSLYFLLFLSVSGWGSISNKIFKIDVKNFPLNLLLGIILLTFISYISIFFIKHDSIFNILIHSLGVIFFVKNFKSFNIDKSYYFIILAISIALIVSKNHDDFPFYHFQQAFNFSTNKFQIGLANLDFSYAHNSSLLFLNSLFYFPVVKYYLYNAPNLIFYTSLILLFYQSLNKAFLKIEIYKIEFVFLLLTIVYCLVKFSRLSEFGTDLTGQILVFYLFYLFLNFDYVVKNFNLIHIILVFLLTLKTYFITYFLLVFVLMHMIGYKLYFKKLFQQKFLVAFTFCFLLVFFVTNFMTSGCIIYPIAQFCFENFSWSLTVREVQEYNIWYEKWAKGIAGTNYLLDESENLLSNLNWLNNWFLNYFFNKVLDNISLISFIILILFTMIKIKNYEFKNENTLKNKNFLLLYLPIFLIFLFWFFKHPTLRYGGYAPLFITIVFPIVYYLSKYEISQNFKKIYSILVISSFVIFISKNIYRINKEFLRDDFYKFTNFPYYKLEENVKYFKINLNDNISVSYPVKGTCWNSPPPCSTTKNITAKKKYNFIIFAKKNQ